MSQLTDTLNKISESLASETSQHSLNAVVEHED